MAAIRGKDGPFAGQTAAATACGYPGLQRTERAYRRELTSQPPTRRPNEKSFPGIRVKRPSRGTSLCKNYTDGGLKQPVADGCLLPMAAPPQKFRTCRAQRKS